MRHTAAGGNKVSLMQNIRKVLKRVVPRRWLPREYLRAKVAEVSQGAVVAGPFRSMKYVDKAFCSALLPKLLGVYERELYDVVELACHSPVERVIDIGAAEGYYAVGFALRRPNLPVIAFEMDPAAAETAAELAKRNGVQNRVEIRGECRPSDLAALTEHGASLVICDCEGAEQALLDPAIAKGLTRSYILVELHEFIVAGITATMRERFGATHRISEIWQQPRTRADFKPTDWYIRRMEDHDLLGVIDEARPIRMNWLWMEPLAASAIGS